DRAVRATIRKIPRSRRSLGQIPIGCRARDCEGVSVAWGDFPKRGPRHFHKLKARCAAHTRQRYAYSGTQPQNCHHGRLSFDEEVPATTGWAWRPALSIIPRTRARAITAHVRLAPVRLAPSKLALSKLALVKSAARR